MAAGDLTTLTNLKLWLPIPPTTTAEDVTLSRLITAVSADFTRATRRPDLLAADYTEVRQGDGGTRLIAYHWPINSIATLRVGGVTITASTDKIENGYYVDEDIDPERIWNIYLIGSCFTDGAAIALDYNAGYAAVPGDIEQAVIDWIVYRYKGRPNVGTQQRRMAEGESVSVEQVDAPPNVLSVIERYTRKFPSVNRAYEERQERMQQHAAARGGRGR
jgi:hypothetical protein